MANIKITDLTELNDPDSTDVLPIVDVGADVTKKVSVGEVVGKISGDVDVATDGTSSIASGAIVNDDINASAAIADTKLDTISTAGKVSNSATTATDANTASAIVARDASGDFTAGTITADLTGNADTATKLDSSRTFEVTGDVTGTVSSDLTSGASIATSIASGVIVDADVNAAAAIAGTKIDPDFGSQNIETSGDINLDDGGTYTTTLQIVTPTADRTISFPDATGTVALVAGSNGQLIYNSSGAQAGLSTLTTDGTDVTLTGRFISSLNGAASEPPGTFTGTWFTGGTATTTKPQVLIEPTGTTSTAWSTSGTGLGVNAESGFSGLLADLQLNGTSEWAFGTTALTVGDANDIAFGTTTGTKLGTATSQKIGFYDATPVVQPTTGVTEAAFVENSGGTAVNVDSTFGGYTIQQVVQALQDLGLLA